MRSIAATSHQPPVRRLQLPLRHGWHPLLAHDEHHGRRRHPAAAQLNEELPGRQRDGEFDDQVAACAHHLLRRQLGRQLHAMHRCQ